MPTKGWRRSDDQTTTPITWPPSSAFISSSIRSANQTTGQNQRPLVRNPPTLFESEPPSIWHHPRHHEPELKEVGDTAVLKFYMVTEGKDKSNYINNAIDVEVGASRPTPFKNTSAQRQLYGHRHHSPRAWKARTASARNMSSR